APSIRKMDVDETEGTLTLEGMFGSQSGRVTMNDSVLAIKQWESHRIVAELPAVTAPGGWGNVMVSVRGHESNTVPLTRWHGALHYEVDFSQAYEPPLKQQADYELYFRADVHSYRDRPGEAPITPDNIPFTIAKQSTAKWKFSGSGKPKPGMTYHLDGSGTMPVYEPPADPMSMPHVFNFWGAINAEDKSVLGKLSADMGSEAGGTLTIEARDGRMAIIHEEATPMKLLPVDFMLVPIRFQLDEHFTIKGDKRQGTIGFGSIAGQLDWDDIVAEIPPNQDTYARRGRAENLARGMVTLELIGGP
ncbi:MAG: hypothetical protein OEU36_24040, partial [Gammaproteobacteria bacterium]|nr:hypothetical protein [Gammaproteobacteria bacterium]